MKPVLVIEQEVRLAGHGVLGERLRARRMPVVAVRVWEDDLSRLDARDYTAIVPMGSNLSAWQEDEHRFLRDERRLLASALDADVPVLGICLGAQLLARAGGAELYEGDEPEIGWLAVHPTPEAAGDPLFATAGERAGVFQYHKDTFDLPRGATRLASSPAFENQAFRLGRAWGVQFHPEVDFRQFDIWIENHREDAGRAGHDVAALRAAVRRGHAAEGAFSRELIDAFLELVDER